MARYRIDAVFGFSLREPCAMVNAPNTNCPNNKPCDSRKIIQARYWTTQISALGQSLTCTQIGPLFAESPSPTEPSATIATKATLARVSVVGLRFKIPLP